MFEFFWRITNDIYCIGLVSCNTNALVNVNSQGPPAGNPGDSDRVYLTYTGESDSLILTLSGDIWQKHFNQFERIVAYF